MEDWPYVPISSWACRSCDGDAAAVSHRLKAVHRPCRSLRCHHHHHHLHHRRHRRHHRPFPVRWNGPADRNFALNKKKMDKIHQNLFKFFHLTDKNVWTSISIFWGDRTTHAKKGKSDPSEWAPDAVRKPISASGTNSQMNDSLWKWIWLAVVGVN